MNEQLPDNPDKDLEEFETSIDRKYQRVVRQVGNRALYFLHANTNLYEFHEPYEMMNHSFHVGENSGLYLFYEDFPELIEELKENKFRVIKAKYPTVRDEMHYVQSRDKILGQDMKRFEDRGEMY